MGYYVGDIPAQDLVLDPARGGINGEEPIDLTPYNQVDVTLFAPDGAEVLTPGFLGTVTPESVVIEWPATSPFEDAGIYHLRVVLMHSTEPQRETIPDTRLVVDLEDGWHTLESARLDWLDAPGYDSWLYELLWSAKQQVLAYAPALAAGVRPPLNYRRAQLLQARNNWNAGKVDPASGGLGEDSFVIQPYPLDWTIKQILRPKTGVPVVG